MTVINCPHCGKEIGVIVEKQKVEEGQQKIVDTCSDCGIEVTSQKVVDYSLKNFDRVLCMGCQKK